MKPIILTQEAKDNALEIFKKLLESASGDGDLKINITTETLLQEQGIEKPTIFILATAYVKMMSLINSSDKELAWYGVATRVKHNYFIEDILVYPQTVTSATVDADEEKCAKWFMELPDDIINNLKFQGHSHVKMGASPSGRDTNNWQQFANLLKPGEFMILCIGNQRSEFYWNIYDKAINVFFENKDITTVIVDDKGNSINTWAKESINKYIIAEQPRITTLYQASRSSTQTSINLNGHSYAATPVANKKINKKNDKKYEEMISYIPADMVGEVDYDSDSDTYFTEVIGLPGFIYSHLYECYLCAGHTFRTKYPKTVASKKEKKNK